MINEITLGTESLRITILGREVEVLTGGFMKTPLEKEVIEGAVADLPVDLQERMVAFLEHGYPVVFREVSILKGDKFAGVFYPMSDNTCVLMLGVDRKGRLDVQTLHHELIHYDQFVRGDLAVSSTGEIIWRGEFYPAPNGKIGRAYLNTPWEQEAYAKQFEWAYEEGLSRIPSTVRMGICQSIAGWNDFIRTWQGAAVVTLVLIVLMWTMPTGGYWWIPQGMVGTYAFLQGVGAACLNPFARKWANKALDKGGKVRAAMAKMVISVNAN